MKKYLFAACALAAMAASALPAQATTVTLAIEASYARSNPFGMAFDGANIWWANGSGTISEMSTSGVDSGRKVQGPQWSALAYDDATHKLAMVTSGGITEFDRATAVGTTNYAALNPVFKAIAGSPHFLVDGLDIHGGDLWWSQDVAPVYKSNLDGTGSASLILSGSYSGIEFLTAGSHDFLAVVNDASNPRQLCLHETNAVLIGCTTLVNDRYEDIAWDGTFLWAADYYGNKIDKIRLMTDGVVIGGGGVPEPATWALMILGFGLVGATQRRRRGSLAA